jgi:RNA polymerase sigma-70 factor (ECF subfamily)
LDAQPTRPWTDPGQDPLILNAAQRGDATALLRLFGAYRLALWRACLAITRHKGEAERLYQETLVHATRNLRAAPSGRPMLPWLVKLARQLDASHMRDRPQRPTVGNKRPNGEPWLAGARGAHYVEDEQRTLHAFSLLHADDQWLLVLRLLERLPYAEIARITELPVPRVMNLIALAREHIDQTRDAEDQAA